MQKISSDIVNEIDKQRKGKHDIDTTIIHIMEEIGEIAREIYSEKIGRAELDIKNLRGEFADVYMLLAHLANHLSIDLENSIKEKIEELKKRFDLK